AIIGSMKTEKWTDRTSGQERSRQIVKVGRLELLGSKRDAEQSQPDPADEEVPF
ncbi:MAG: single-stranded DNA-binding protein, partial [Caulobacteraceae bacterium]|nr:single-stranded DNA-binding protein [Caulobacteraceae bacterium]